MSLTEDMFIALGLTAMLGLSAFQGTPADAEAVTKPVTMDVSQTFVSKIDMGESYNISDMLMTCVAKMQVTDTYYAEGNLEMPNQTYTVRAYMIDNNRTTYLVFYDSEGVQVHNVFYNGRISKIGYRVQGNLLCLKEDFDGDSDYVTYDTSVMVNVLGSKMFDIQTTSEDMLNQEELILTLRKV